MLLTITNPDLSIETETKATTNSDLTFYWVYAGFPAQLFGDLSRW